MKKLLNSIKSLSLVKKIIAIAVFVLLIVAIVVYFVFGRSSDSYGVKVSKGSTALVSGDVTVTKQQYFDYLLSQNGAQSVVSDALEEIADKEVTDQDAIDDLLDERLETYKSYATDGLTAYAKSLGYKSKQAWIDDALLPDVKQELLRKDYIEKNIKSLMNKYNVCSFKKIVVEKESTALKLIKKCTTEEKFDAYMANEKYSSNAEDCGIVTKDSTLDDNLIKVLDDLSKVEKDGVYSKAIKLSDDTYAVIYLYDTDKSDTDSYIEKFTSDDDLTEEVEGSLLADYNFTVYSKKLKQDIKTLSDAYID